MPKSPRYWTGDTPKACDMCEEPITHTFTDGRAIRRRAPWNSTWCKMCPLCAAAYGGYGPGMGQEYSKQPTGQWLKTKG